MTALPFNLNFDFYYRLTKRERALSLLVVGTVFFLLNLVALRTLAVSFRSLGRQRAEKAQEVAANSIYREEKPKWTERANWIRAKQPVLTNRDVAGSDLLAMVKRLADQNKVIISNQTILPLTNAQGTQTPDHQTVGVQMDVKGAWLDLVHFMYAVQQPEMFMAFESATLHTDGADKQTHVGTFRIAIWYAPSGK